MPSPRKRWTDETILAELTAFVQRTGHFPTRSELVKDGLRGLWDAMRAHGGPELFEQRLTTETTVADRPVSHEQVAKRAYELWEFGAAGGPVDHWLAAEAELAPR